MTTTSRECDAAQNFLPRASQVPRNVIQNDSSDQPQRRARTTGSPDVEAVVAELLPARDVARRVDLRDAGQAGRRRGSARRTPARPRAPLAGRRRAPRSRRAAARAGRRSSCRRGRCSELRQLVHRRRAQQPADARDRAGRRRAPAARRRCASASGIIDRNLRRGTTRPPQADALLAEEDVAAVLELDGRRDRRPRPAATHQPGAGERDVEGALRRERDAGAALGGRVVHRDTPAGVAWHRRV